MGLNMKETRVKPSDENRHSRTSRIFRGHKSIIPYSNRRKIKHSNEEMKVQELRKWLQDFGDKNKEHYQRGRSTQSQKKTGNSESFTASLGGNVKKNDRNQSHAFDPFDVREPQDIAEVQPTPLATDKYGDINANVSSDPTEESSSSSTSEGTLNNSGVNAKSFDTEDFSEPKFGDEDSFDFPPSEPFSESSFALPPPPGFEHLAKAYVRQSHFGGIDGMPNVGYEHFDLVRRCQTGLDHYLEGNRRVTSNMETQSLPAPQSGKMHSANIFGNRTLTSKTLDFICDKHPRESPFEKVNGSVFDDSTASAESRDSQSPSISPDALESKVAKQLLDSRDKVAVSTSSSGILKSPPSTPTRKKVDPKSLDFLQPKAVPKKTIEGLQQGPPPTTAVGKGIRKFGGPKKTIIESRKEQLETKWAENKKSKYVTKIKWGVCSKTGTYKKKVVLDVE